MREFRQVHAGGAALREEGFPRGMELASRGASDEVLADVERRLGIVLPDDYRAFLRAFDGGSGLLAHENYVHLWQAAELVERNAGYEAAEFYAGYLLIGSNGGGEAIAVRLDTASPEYVFFPFIGGPEHAVIGGSSLKAFLERWAAGELLD